MDEVVLGQRGRATIDFHCAVRGAVAKLQRAVEAELSDAGINAQTMPEKMDDRHRLVDHTLARSPVYGARALLGEWTAKDHGPICQDAFAEIRETVEPMLKALEDGPATLELDETLELPAYFERVWFHRTTGGWDASEHNGFVHGELIHKRILTRVFGGNIFGHRRTAAAKAPPAPIAASSTWGLRRAIIWSPWRRLSPMRRSAASIFGPDAGAGAPRGERPWLGLETLSTPLRSHRLCGRQLRPGPQL
ncbi:MAG: hypothetical protein U5M50_16130 [Sphingobium sp.]|nr:hypothetical protein [Sphingobium sp.]